MEVLQQEVSSRVEWIKNILASSGAKGIVYGNSGGKDCTLVGILAKMATDNVTGIIMPCESTRNYGIDREHALMAGEKYGINTVQIDLTPVKKAFREVLGEEVPDVGLTYANINPRLRMTTLYAYAQSHGYLVAGTGNRSECEMGYFTKWGDGAFDFNPIADLTVNEVFEMLRFLGAPREIIEKAPSAGLFEGQTDEEEMGITYEEVDEYLLTGEATPDVIFKVENAKAKSAHKRRAGRVYPD